MFKTMTLKTTEFGYYWSYDGKIVSDLFKYKNEAYQWLREKAQHKTY